MGVRLRVCSTVRRPSAYGGLSGRRLCLRNWRGLICWCRLRYLSWLWCRHLWRRRGCGLGRRRVFFSSGSLMHCTNLWWGTFYAPHWFGQVLVLLLFVLEQVGDWRWEFLHFLGVIEEIHLIVAIPHLIGQAACPSFDLVELVSFLIVSGLAYVDLDVSRQATRSSFEVASCEHDKTSSFNLVN